MPPSAKELDAITDGLVRRLGQRADDSTKTYILFKRLGRWLMNGIRVSMIAVGLVSTLLISTLFLNKWSAGYQNLGGLLLAGLLSTTAHWFLIMRRFPMSASLGSLSALLWILFRGGI